MAVIEEITLAPQEPLGLISDQEAAAWSTGGLTRLLWPSGEFAGTGGLPWGALISEGLEPH